MFFFAELFEDNAGLLDWYLDDLGQTYRPGFLFLFIMAWWVMLMVLGFPLVLYLFQTVSTRDSEQNSNEHILGAPCYSSEQLQINLKWLVTNP